MRRCKGIYPALRSTGPEPTGLVVENAGEEANVVAGKAAKGRATSATTRRRVNKAIWSKPAYAYLSQSGWPYVKLARAQKKSNERNSMLRRGRASIGDV
ncbi:hypothetical protein R54767_00309 [Paraburkholderia gardini]|uniref:Uncharacterized protein n=1 Tax=Paraburkholderia gardini TaxID=2823469 RepID=A0ABN7QIF6_9BURK|nr:hypothetical protein R54767_00309 [Paraburkholderia gardini]